MIRTHHFRGLIFCAPRTLALIMAHGIIMSMMVVIVSHDTAAQSSGDTLGFGLRSSATALPAVPSDVYTGGVSPHLSEANAGERITSLRGINSPDRDNSPVLSANGRTLFFNSTRRGHRPWARFNAFRGRYDDDVYVAHLVTDNVGVERWGDPINLGSSINSSGDDGIIAVSADGSTIFFSSFKPGWQRNGGPFFTARCVGDTFADVVGMGGGITGFFANAPEGGNFRIYGGTIAPDGREFYFATTAASLTGNHQIWVSRLGDDGWGVPENLGSRVNHFNGSYAPYMAADGINLYFSCQGANSLGGDDIYVTNRSQGTWCRPQNIGTPINTPGDDAFLSIPMSGDHAYFAMITDGNEDIHETLLRAKLCPVDTTMAGSPSLTFSPAHR